MEQLSARFAHVAGKAMHVRQVRSVGASEREGSFLQWTAKPCHDAPTCDAPAGRRHAKLGCYSH